jgi:AAA+ superfamily predicted ATPase
MLFLSFGVVVSKVREQWHNFAAINTGFVLFQGVIVDWNFEVVETVNTTPWRLTKSSDVLQYFARHRLAKYRVSAKYLVEKGG